MTDTAATFDDVISFDGRIVSPGVGRRAVRFLLGGVVVGLGSAAAVAALIAAVTVTAVWIVNSAFVTHPDFQAKAPTGPAALTLARHDRTADAADITGSIQASTDAADASTFERQWGRAMALAASGAMPLMSELAAERASKVALLPPQPLRPARGKANAEIAHAADATHLAALTPPAASPGIQTPPPKLTLARASSVPLPRPAPHPAQQDIARAPAAAAAPQIALASVSAAPPPPAKADKPVAQQEAHNKAMPLPDPDNRTAVYDIAAHTVYLPNGKKLEAHSGLGDKLDDPRYVRVKDRGPTPPNVYDLTLREQLFHEVRAIRLNPVDEKNMFGRDGMLAHTYMLGANGQSNGCVSFKDYPAFLHAYLNGEIDRLVVVPSLGNTSWRTASARLAPRRRYADNDR